jgi:hypothetical protein
VQFRTAKATEHIVPALLKKVWEQDNNKEQTLWEMGNQGGVSGDCFVKIAWDPKGDDPGQLEDRVRIMVLNSSFCFPEWHPHDRSRLMRFKLKYRFWGTSTEGTRQVYTYTEILTDEAIEEYVNDTLMDSRPNPLNVIPIVHIANIPVSGSPWGLSDIQDIISLNREYNEKATDISDIINYHAAPVTIITGAKASNLEKGPKKVWGGLPEKARVENLLGGTEALPHALTWLEQIKRSMHELTGVPETALGQVQPISNTSGVALAIQYQPMMQRYNLKKIQYTVGIQRVNEFILRTLAVFQPYAFVFDPDTEGVMQEGQLPVLDTNDPLTFQSFVHWPPPLPLDILIKLQEITLKKQLGLISDRKALLELGVEFPDEELEENFQQQVQDIKRNAALSLLKAQYDSVTLQMTGIPPEGVEEPTPQTDAEGNAINTPDGPAPVQSQTFDPTGLTGFETQQKMTELVTQAYGPRVPLRRNPDSNTDS